MPDPTGTPLPERPEVPPFRRAWKPEGVPTLLLLLLAAAFLISAFGKLAGIDTFGWTLLDAGIPGDRLAATLARLLVGLEAACGLLLLLRIRVRRLALPLALGMLVVFSAYLLYLLAVQGNQGDCGCFGDWLPMKPLPALLKNAGLLLAIALLYRLRGWREWRWPAPAAGALVGALTLAPVLLLPPAPKAAALETALLQDRSRSLAQGKQVVAFLSLGCPHCRTAAAKLAGFYRENPALPIVLVLNGDVQEATGFLEETDAGAVPRLHETRPEIFRKLAGQYVPSIYYLNRGRVERRVSYRTLTRPAIERWLKHP